MANTKSVKSSKSSSAATKKSTAKKASSKATSDAKPSTWDQIDEAILNLKKRGGSSKVAIAKYIMANYGKGTTEDSIKKKVRICIKRGLESVPKHYVQNKQSFSLAPGIVKERSTNRMAENKRTGKLSAIKKVKPSASAAGRSTRPIKQWILEAVSEEEKGISMDDLVASLTKYHKIPSKDQVRFAATTKAITSRLFTASLLIGSSNSIKLAKKGKDLLEEIAAKAKDAKTKVKSKPKAKSTTKSKAKAKSTTKGKGKTESAVKRPVGRPKKVVAEVSDSEETETDTSGSESDSGSASENEKADSEMESGSDSD